MTECASCCSKWVHKARLWKKLAMVVSIDENGELTERMENLWKRQKIYQCLIYVLSGRKSYTAPNWRVQRNTQGYFLKLVLDYIKIQKSKKQETVLQSGFIQYKLLSCPLQCLKCFSAWSLLSQILNSWSNNSVAEDDAYISTVTTTKIAN